MLRPSQLRLFSSSRADEGGPPSDQCHWLCRCAAKRGDEFSPRDVECHLTPPRGHARRGTTSHLTVLRCEISIRLMSAAGQNEKSASSGLCRLLPAAADITPKMLTAA